MDEETCQSEEPVWQTTSEPEVCEEPPISEEPQSCELPPEQEAELEECPLEEEPQPEVQAEPAPAPAPAPYKTGPRGGLMGPDGKMVYPCTPEDSNGDGIPDNQPVEPYTGPTISQGQPGDVERAQREQAQSEAFKAWLRGERPSMPGKGQNQYNRYHRQLEDRPLPPLPMPISRPAR